MAAHVKTVFALVLIVVASVAGEKKPTPPPKRYQNTREFKASCDRAWPVAVRVLTSHGWGVRTSDRAGGILTFEWTRGDITGSYRKINPIVDQYAIKNRTGFWTREYYGFRIVSAQAVAVPQSESCSYTVTVVYHGLAVRTGGIRSWEVATLRTRCSVKSKTTYWAGISLPALPDNPTYRPSCPVIATPLFPWRAWFPSDRPQFKID
jgi:hypothetical protein